MEEHCSGRVGSRRQSLALGYVQTDERLMELVGGRKELMGRSFRRAGNLGYGSGLNGGPSSSNISMLQCSDLVTISGQNSLQV